MNHENRRQFLKRSGAVFTGATLFPHCIPLVGTTDAKTTRPGPDSDPHSSAKSDPQTATYPGKPQPKMRGLMIDAARVPEPLDYYRRVIEFCADWGLNTLQFRLADDQGSALRFSSVPNLLLHPHAFAPEQLHELAAFASSHGVDLIPELESFGHTGFVTRSSTYAHLLDTTPTGSPKFTGVIPVAPETLGLMTKLYREVATIFPSPYLHGGCDEVNWGGSALSQQALRTKSRARIWGEYLNALNQLTQNLGKQFIIWGDFVLHKEPEILLHLNRSIIVMDWNYWDTDPALLRNALVTLKNNGSRAIGAPALINYQWGPRAGTKQLRNMDAFAEVYSKPGDPTSLGVICTNWVPSRYLQNSIWDGFAYAAVAFNDGAAEARLSAFRRFVERHYHATWNESWNEVFQLIYDLAPAFGERNSPPSPHLPVPWSSDAELLSSLKDRSPQANPFIHLRTLVDRLSPSVRANVSDFEAFALSFEYLENLFWRETIIPERAAGRPIDHPTASLLIRDITKRDQKLAASLTTDWDRGRFSDSDAKLRPLFGMEPKDQLLFQWNRAAAYSASLARKTDRFHYLLQSAGLAEE
jgi:hypothetical protein